MVKNKLGLSAFVLVLSGVICKVLGALFRLPLTNLLGIEGIGVFQLVMAVYAFALVVTCGGVTNSLSKLISAARANQQFEKINLYLKRAVFESVLLGIALGAVFFVFGKHISVFQGISPSGSYLLFAVLLPLGALLAAFRGFFQGYENMIPTAISQFLEQVFKFVFGLLFAFYFGKIGMPEGVFGAFLGIVVSEIVALGYLFVVYFFKSKNFKSSKGFKEYRFVYHEFDKANLLMASSFAILPLASALEGMFIVSRLGKAGFSSSFATQLFGLQTGVVGTLLNFPLVISMAVTTTLLPNITYLLSRGTGSRQVIEKGLKILLFLILPTTFGLTAISPTVLPLLYKNLDRGLSDLAFNLMLYGSFSIIFTALMQYLVMLLQANGEYRFILLITIFGGVAKIVVAFVLSAFISVNVYALVLGNIALSAIVCLCALYKLKRTIAFRLKFVDLFNVIFSTFCMFLTVYTFSNCNYFGAITNLALSIALGGLVYLVLTTPFLLRIGLFGKKVRQKV